MLRIFAILFLAFTPSLGQAILFKSADVSQEQFQKAALQKNQKTYTDWYFDQRSDDLSEAHQQVQDFAHDLLKNILKPSPRQLEDWKYLRATIPLNNADIEILFLLAQKLNIKKELCRYLVLRPALDPKLASASGCREVSETFPAAILAKMNRRDLLLIDGLPFRKESSR